MFYEIYLPFPPSNNHYYVKTKRGVFISQKGRKFRDSVAEAVLAQLPGIEIDFPILVESIYFMPDSRKRDVANYSKALHDAITESGLWEDDSLVNQNFEYRGEVVKKQGQKGCVLMRISEAGPVIKFENGFLGL